MKLSTKGRYGIRAVVNLAASGMTKPVSIKNIALAEEISPEFLEQIFFKLKKAKIIRSVRGPGGGFSLNKQPADITIKDILDAVDESIWPVPCTDSNKKCLRNQECFMHQTWQELSEIIAGYLSNATIQSILDKNRQSPHQAESNRDFTI